MSITYSVQTYTSRGGRPYNEDSLAAQPCAGGLFAVVADGLGRHGGGDVASGMVVDTLLHCCASGFTLEKKGIAAYLDQANKAVLQRQTPACKMKSTVVLLLCAEDQALIAHVGDSRGYYFRNGSIAVQTVDHSVSQMAVSQGEITPAQIRFHEDRSRLLRALGGSGTLHWDEEPIPALAAGDAFLLCSDGFWEYVTEAEMEVDLLKSQTPGQWISFMLTRMGKRIDGENDNASAVAVFCDEDVAAQAEGKRGGR